MKKPRSNVCVMCQNPIAQPRHGRPRRTCSDVCRQHQQRNKQLPDPEMRKRIREAERLMQIWEKRWGKFDRDSKVPGAMKERERLLLYLRNDWMYGICRHCDRPHIPDKSIGGDWFYCSRKCLKASHRLVDRIYKMKEAGEIVTPTMQRQMRLSRECAHCGELFKPKSLDQKYHSPGCRKKAYQQRLARMPLCAQCGTKFERYRSSHRFCTRRCREAHDRRMKRGRVPVKYHPPIICAWCGDEAKASSNGLKRFCCIEHKFQYHSYKNGKRKRLPPNSPLRSTLPSSRLGINRPNKYQ